MMSQLLSRNLRLFSFLLLTVNFSLMPQWASAKDCAIAYAPLLDKVSQFTDQLQTISSRSAYSEHVKKRYIELDDILEISLHCAKNERLSAAEKKQWHGVNQVMVLLQSSAKKSAFTDFDDWVAAKAIDLSHYQRLQASL